MFEIDNEVPMPGNALREAVDAMEPGDSLHVTTDSHRQTAMKHGKAYESRRYVSRTVKEDDPRGPGSRIWRVE